ncbi:hypothetical protein B0H16DRAFT_1703676 [Mycena metata]|uniref:Uncharacterized protein n=1 Tax=Mycena metata TaxID=1033252 RepID=A0AAD7H1R0_9AGAR|nr:hypothetical protein B0H16DRAFT_1703676 [Mycena metata]
MVDWYVHWYGTVKRGWWVLGGVVGRMSCAVDSDAPSKRRMGHRGRNGRALHAPRAGVVEALVLVACLLSPATRPAGLFLLAPIRRPPRIPPKRNTMNFKTICDTTGHNSLGRASRDATEPEVLTRGLLMAVRTKEKVNATSTGWDPT